MSGPASLSGALPDGSANGLAHIAADLVEHPTTVRVAVILFDTVKVTNKVDTGATIATVRVRRIEPITDSRDAEQRRHLLQREFDRRTGDCVLPFELEEDVRNAFDVPDAVDDEDEKR
jgi:hypothetical protein